MKQYLILLFFFISITCNSQNIVLRPLVADFGGGFKMFHNYTQTIIDEEIWITLEIVDEKGNLIRSNGDFKISNKNNFSTSFSIIPEKEGKLIVGPYELEINGEKYISNNLQFDITEKVKIDEIDLIAPTLTTVGNTIFIDIVSSDKRLLHTTIKPSSYYSSKFVEDDIETLSQVNGNKKIKYYILRYQFTFLKKGSLKWFEDIFENYPNDLLFRERKILIKK